MCEDRTCVGTLFEVIQDLPKPKQRIWSGTKGFVSQVKGKDRFYGTLSTDKSAFVKSQHFKVVIFAPKAKDVKRPDYEAQVNERMKRVTGAPQEFVDAYRACLMDVYERENQKGAA